MMLQEVGFDGLSGIESLIVTYIGYGGAAALVAVGWRLRKGNRPASWVCYSLAACCVLLVWLVTRPFAKWY